MKIKSVNNMSGIILALSTVYSVNVYSAPAPCIDGFVWREAFPGDYVCVLPDIRRQAAEDNRLAKSRIQPGGGKYGKDTCKQGFVWREARKNDHVCVEPNTRKQTQIDNQVAAKRVASSTSGSKVAKPRVAAVQHIACPANEITAEIVTQLPSEWWQTPQQGRVKNTSIENIGGKKTLVCHYQAYGRTVPVMREMPGNVRNCQAVRNGFKCQ